MVSFMMQKTGLALSAVSRSEPQGAVFHQETARLRLNNTAEGYTEQEEEKQKKKSALLGGLFTLLLFSVSGGGRWGEAGC